MGDFDFENLESLTIPEGEVAEISVGGVVVWQAKSEEITFTINGTSYTALSGMTWGEWVESEYSNNNYEIVAGGYVRHKPSIGQVWVKDDNGTIYSTQLIQNGVAYKHGTHSGGSN